MSVALEVSSGWSISHCHSAPTGGTHQEVEGGVVVGVVVVGGVVVGGVVVVVAQQLMDSDVRAWLVTVMPSPAQVTLAVSPTLRLRLRLWVTAAAMP
jgi:hypothetical protein